MLELLIELGADLEAKDNRGRTPLAVAVLRGDAEATRLLKAGGAASLGFTVINQYEDHGELVFAKLSFGQCEFGLSPGGNPGPRDVSLWFYTDRVQDLYELLKARRVPFDEDLYVPFYGGRQFSIRDINGLSLIFWQPDWLTSRPG